MTNPTFNAAMEYRALGWSVIPVSRDDKEPAIKRWKPYQERQPSDMELLDWFDVETLPNLGVITGGLSGIIVLDVDGEPGKRSLEDRELPPTRTAKTPHGLHHYFRDPGGEVRNMVRFVPGLDLRGDGGYAIAPPSSYPHGSYEWLDEREIAEAPDWLLTFCRQRSSSPKSSLPGGVSQGERNQRCTSIVGGWFRAGFAEDEVMAMALTWNQRNEPPMDQSEAERIVESIAQRHAQGQDFRLQRFDWTAPGPVEHPWVWEPLFTKAARIWVIGEPESAKSLYLASVCARLADERSRVLLISEENSALEERRRLSSLGADPNFLTVFHHQGIDLSKPGWQRAVLTWVEAEMPVLVVFDSFTSIWGGDENSNAEVAAFDREVLTPIADLGVTSAVVHHPPRPSEGRERLGARSGRGASASGDKADLVFNFQKAGDNQFKITRGKNRLGLPEIGEVMFKVVDLDDGGLLVDHIGGSVRDSIDDLADRIVEAVRSSSEPRTIKSLRREFGDARIVRTGLDRLRREQPPRIYESEERTLTAGGLQPAKVWRPAPPQPQGGLADQGGWGGQGGSNTPPLTTPPGRKGHRLSFGCPRSELDDLFDSPA